MTNEFQPLSPQEEDRGSRRQQGLVVLLLLAVGVVAVGLWITLSPSQTPHPPVPENLPPLGTEEEAYGKNIDVGRLQLSRWANFLGQEVIYLDGVVSNRGDRSVAVLEVTLEFKDPYGQVVLRETIRPIGGKLSAYGALQGPLAAGESREFRAGFEHMPADWNQGGPDIRVSGLLLQ